MITGIASCPNPPLLLPGATGLPVAEVEQLRAACVAAIGQVLASRPDALVIVGAGAATDVADEALSVQVAQALLAHVGAAVDLEVQVELIPADLPPQDCAQLGQQLAADDRSLALLIMADGSARRNLKAPGYFDERAEPFDTVLEAALKSADAEALAELNPQLANELLVAGRPAWQVMAAAASASLTSAAPALQAQRWQVTDHYFAAPFGVFYPVLTWMPL